LLHYKRKTVSGQREEVNSGERIKQAQQTRSLHLDFLMYKRYEYAMKMACCAGGAHVQWMRRGPGVQTSFSGGSNDMKMIGRFEWRRTAWLCVCVCVRALYSERESE
jgi:hypothetical protein